MYRKKGKETEDEDEDEKERVRKSSKPHWGEADQAETSRSRQPRGSLATRGSRLSNCFLTLIYYNYNYFVDVMFLFVYVMCLLTDPLVS